MYLLLAIMVGLSSCSSTPHSKSQTASSPPTPPPTLPSPQANRVGSHFINALGLSPPALLGQGYNSATKALLGPCLRTLPKAGGSKRYRFAGAAQATANMERVVDDSALAHALGFEASAKARFGLASAEAAARFHRESTARASADTFSFQAEIRARDVLLNLEGSPSELLEPSKAALRDNALPRVGEAFRVDCGDSFVYGVRRGARLFVTVKIEYDSLSSKQTYSASLRISGGWGSLASNLAGLSSEARKHAAVKIIAHQIGGDTNKLASIFGSQNSSTAGSTGTLPNSIECSLQNPTKAKACQALLAQIVNYAANEFAQQLPAAYDPARPGNAFADLEYFIEPWGKAGVRQAPQLYADNLDRLRTQLEQEFMRQLEQQSLAEQLLGGSVVQLGSSDRAKIEADRQKIAENMDSISGAFGICYGSGDVRDVERACDRELKGPPEGLLKRLDANRTHLSIRDLQPTRYGSHCTVAAGDECLRCESTLADITSEAQTLARDRNAPELLQLECTHMPRDQWVAVTMSGSLKFTSFNADGNHGDWFAQLGIVDQLGQRSQPEHVAGTIEWLPFETNATTVVPTDRTVRVQPFLAAIQAWPAIHTGVAKLKPDFRIVIEARERMRSLGLR